MGNHGERVVAIKMREKGDYRFIPMVAFSTHQKWSDAEMQEVHSV